MLEKSKKHFSCFQTAHILPSSLSRRLGPTNPDKKTVTVSKLSPPPTYNVDNRGNFFSFCWKKRDIFQHWLGGMGDTWSSSSVPTTFGRDCSLLQAKLFVTPHRVPLPYLMLHNLRYIKSECDVNTLRFWPHDDRDKLQVFWKLKNAFKIFPALLKLQNVFHGYQLQKQDKNFLVICTLIQPELELIIFIIYVAWHVSFQIYTLAAHINNLVRY